MATSEADRQRVAGKPHGDPDHACSWSCPESDPMADIRAVGRDITAGMTAAEIEARHYRPGPFSYGPEPASDVLGRLAGEDA